MRFGYGIFYDRLSESATLQARRYNGTTQQSYLIQNPDTYPSIPSVTSLEQGRQPQRLQWIEGDYRAPRVLQSSVSIERQVTSFLKLSAQYMNGRGLNQQRSRNINAPINGVYPYGDRQLRIYTESSGSSRTNTLVISPNVTYKRLFLFGFYSYGNGKNNTEGQPADPYNLRNEWGASSFADIRHRFIMGTSLPLPFRFNVSPFFMFSSGSPYNITTGRDTNGDGFTSERPSLLAGRSSADCRGGDLIYTAEFGCFDASGASTAIARNYGRGPSNANLSLRLSRTWAFGTRGESGPSEGGPPPGMGGVRGGGMPGGGGGPGGPGGGGPPPGMGPGGPGGGGPPRGLFGPDSGKKYNLMLTLSARNLINRANYAAPSGDLSSPYFGEYRSLAGFGPFGNTSTYNRKIDIQLRFTF